jgi:hypothetical protein
MATTTTNFGWDIPQSTDLVKDGATAIAALGQDIDTAFIDLKGGTTGQVLAKASGTDLDFSWVAQDDSNAIQNAIVDAKGDLIAATADNTPARLAVGTNGHILTADSTAATGIKWAAAPSPTVTFAGCKAFTTVAQTVSSGVYSDITWNSETFDTDGYHSTSSNTARITIPAGKAGAYEFTGYLSWDTGTSGFRLISIQKNGTGSLFTANMQPGADYPSQIATVIDNAAAVGDYYILRVYHNQGGNQTLNNTGAYASFSCNYLGA